ncbi:MAG: hypothetical protein SGBAC_003259 [Bacillariaceae sp.]
MPDARSAKGEEGAMYHHGPTRERGEKKKVGWKKTLSTSEPLTPEDRSPNWDSETGNMLSYFLGDPLSGGENYASGLPMDQKMDYQIPPTPATRYYYHSESKPKASNEASRSLNNPLMKMKVSKSSDSRINAGDQPMGGVLSPISPTSMLGSGEEPLMLPPPPNTQYEAYKKHISLLQMNTVANGVQRKGIHEPQSIVSIPPPPGVAMPQPLQYTSVPAMQPVAMQQVTNPALYAHAALIQQHVSSPAETEEKRAKRLERNRESARRSRRKKKERLSSLEEKVSNMYQRIETERRIQINCMDDALEDDLADSVATIRAIVGHTAEQEEQKARLAHFLQSTGLNSKVRRSVLDFQYTTLKQTILPPYHKFVLWMTLLPERFFTHARESHVIQDTKKVRPPPGKLSSKQVGEELTNSDKGEKVGQTAKAVDEARMWPLLCFELSTSVDQEEKMVHILKK